MGRNLLTQFKESCDVGRGSLVLQPQLEGRKSEFQRELVILLQMKKTGLSALVSVPELRGIVISTENSATAMGMRMTLIVSPDTGTHLQSQNFWNMLELHDRWERQVLFAVQELHAHCVVWGDVYPINIVIDEAINAWIIDFGGMNNVEFVDDEKRETMEGDIQGVTRLFREWLPSHNGLREED